MNCPICFGDPGWNCIHSQEQMLEHTAKQEGISLEEMYERAYPTSESFECSGCTSSIDPTCQPSTCPKAIQDKNGDVPF